MDNNILQTWEYKAKITSQSLVIPDGCRDVLFWQPKGKAPNFLITSLDKKSYRVKIKQGDYLKGFRLSAGTKIDEQKLLSSLNEINVGHIDIIDRIGNFTSLCPNVKEALTCLSSDILNIKQAAKLLGISTRTLQRLLTKQTMRTPISWLSLARVRRAARAISKTKAIDKNSNLAQVAISMNYADQSHMNREFRRWLDVSPAKIHQEKEILNQLKNIAYY